MSTTSATKPCARQRHDVLLARQPICDGDLEVVAYELLFRSSAAAGTADFRDGDRATSQTLVNAFVEFGLERVVEGKTAFVNMTRAFLVGEFPLPLPSANLVLEVLEDIEIDAELVAALTKLKAEGHLLALDDVVYKPELQPLLPLADVIKVELPAIDPKDLRRHVELLRGANATLLAEKVETHEEFERCRELGFDLFQGYFFAKPRLVEGKTLSTSQLVLVQLLAKLQDHDIDVKEIEQLLRRDVSLSYKLLRYLNSAHRGLSRTIDSLRQAIVLLGLRQVRTFATLIALSGVSNRSEGILRTAMARARMGELLAEAADYPEPGKAFTVGLFSCLDALLDVSLETVVEQLPLSPEVSSALLERDGELGKILGITLALEHAEWDAVDLACLDDEKVLEAYVGAVAWADDVVDGLDQGKA